MVAHREGFASFRDATMSHPSRTSPRAPALSMVRARQRWVSCRRRRQAGGGGMAEERPVDLDDASGRGDDAGSRDVPDRGVPDEDRAVGGLGVATRTVGVLDPEVDAHVHSGFSAGHDSIGAIVCAAQLAGLRQVTFGDQVDAQAAWLPAYREAVLRAQRRTDLELRISAEVEVVRPDGWLAFPADLGGLEGVTVAVPRLPRGGRLVEAAEARAMLAAGRLRPADVIEMVVSATV